MRAEVKPCARQVRRLVRPGRGQAVQERAGSACPSSEPTRLTVQPVVAAPGRARILPKPACARSHSLALSRTGRPAAVGAVGAVWGRWFVSQWAVGIAGKVSGRLSPAVAAHCMRLGTFGEDGEGLFSTRSGRSYGPKRQALAAVQLGLSLQAGIVVPFTKRRLQVQNRNPHEMLGRPMCPGRYLESAIPSEETIRPRSSYQAHPLTRLETSSVDSRKISPRRGLTQQRLSRSWPASESSAAYSST